MYLVIYCFCCINYFLSYWFYWLWLIGLIILLFLPSDCITTGKPLCMFKLEIEHLESMCNQCRTNSDYNSKLKGEFFTVFLISLLDIILQASFLGNHIRMKYLILIIWWTEVVWDDVFNSLKYSCHIKWGFGVGVTTLLPMTSWYLYIVEMADFIWWVHLVMG